MKRVLILGVGGQDGSMLCERLMVHGGYHVTGVYRPSSVNNLQRLRVRPHELHCIDITDRCALRSVLDVDTVYNLADQDHVATSWKNPQLALDTTVGAVHTILEAASYGTFVQAISATVFGRFANFATIHSPLDPQSPYAAAKAHAWHLCKMYRSRENLDVRCAILYNHDSDRREPKYLLHEIAKQLPHVKLRDPDQRVNISPAAEVVCELHAFAEGDSQDAIIAGDVDYSCREWAMCMGAKTVERSSEVRSPDMCARHSFHVKTLPEMLESIVRKYT